MAVMLCLTSNFQKYLRFVICCAAYRTEGLFSIVSKGQLISKGLFGNLNSPKKRTKKFDFNTMIPQVDLFSFVFWEKLKTPERHFEIN